MKTHGMMLSALALLTAAAPAIGAECPVREAGAGYPWQTNQRMRGDYYAVIFVDVDQTGRPLKCSIGQNNIPDPETRFRLCQAYKDDWRAPPATVTDPPVRTIKRETVMTGYEHQMADQKARKAWFRAHPEERQECYPE